MSHPTATTMTDHIPGLHHVTAIASDPQTNVDFYTAVLGLRFVKRTVNFDDTSTYHLYYGDEVGTPGTIMTFFPFATSPPGHVGRGQVNTTTFTIPRDSVDYWLDRLDAEGVDADEPEDRFDETVLPFRDHDGQSLELVTGETDIDAWTDGPVPSEHAIRGFHGVTLLSTDPDATATVLETMGYDRAARADDRIRYRTDGERATVVDLLDRPDAPAGRMGTGTVHHVAFRTSDEDAQSAWRETFMDMGLRVTSVKDRQYFKSIYFREPGGILFEIATDGPGFAHDESVDELGSTLKLPPWLEDDRETIARRLPEIDVGTGVRAD